MERDSSAHNCPTIIVVSRHLRDTGNDHGEAQTQADVSNGLAGCHYFGEAGTRPKYLRFGEVVPTGIA
ncbi:MAG: hypothetical protein ACXVAT_19285, partial [Isosphaeraceae bacterium]